MKNQNLSFSSFLLSVSLFSLGSASSLQASFSREEQESFREVTHANIKTILEKYVGANMELLQSSKGKDIVAFIGKTGAGKSTLINYLNGKQLKVNDQGSIILSNPNDSTVMKIGVGFESETFLPQYVNNQNLLFYDLPGIGETRGTAISLVNACFIKGIIENARSTRLIFVIGQDEMTAERGRSFKELFSIMNNLIPNEGIEGFSSITVTKSTPGTDNQRLINRLTGLTEPGVLTPWTQVERLTHMSAPLGEQINQDDKTAILQIIRNTPSKKINNVNIGVIYNDKEQNKIGNIYAAEIEDKFNTLVNNNINMDLLSSLTINVLDDKKRYFENKFFNDLTLLLDKSPLITLLRPFSNDIYLLYCRKSIEDKRVRIQNILEQIETKKAEQLRIQAEKAKQAAEEAKKAEELLRIQAEKDRRAAEEAKREEELLRAQAEKAQQAAEYERQLEQQRRVYAEQALQAAQSSGKRRKWYKF